MIHTRYDVGQGGSSGSGEKWSDSGRFGSWVYMICWGIQLKRKRVGPNWPEILEEMDCRRLDSFLKTKNHFWTQH